MESAKFVGYVEDPPGRGTASLTISCLITLVLCVWSALHLNVPPPSSTRLSLVWCNIRWILAGIYAPELVVFTAWRQWKSAKLLSSLVQGDFAESNGPEEFDLKGARRHGWTFTHSFFASTGGFVLECSPGIIDEKSERLDEEHSQGSGTRHTITARGMLLLARCGHLPDTSLEDILDKSKASGLAKALVMLQASWILLSILGRLVARLPVTLLEVNTVAHVLCAFSLYAMWWNKPLSPNEPVILRGPWADEMFALMYLCSEMSGSVELDKLKSQTVIKTILASVSLYSKTPEMDLLCCRIPVTRETSSQRDIFFTGLPRNSICRKDSERSTAAHFRDFGKLEKDVLRFENCSGECKTILEARRRQKEAATAFFERRPRIHDSSTGANHQSMKTQRRWQLAARALESDPILANECISVSHQEGETICVHFKSQQLVVDHSRNWPSDELLRDVGGLVVGMVLWFANFLYGGIHAAAWNDHFPSTSEKWLWRASASYIAFCGGLWVGLNQIVRSVPRLNEFWERWMDGEKSLWQNLILGGIVFLCGFSLVLARAYVVLEAFISIRQLPIEAYKTPQWSDAFPHLS